MQQKLIFINLFGPIIRIETNIANTYTLMNGVIRNLYYLTHNREYQLILVSNKILTVPENLTKIINDIIVLFSGEDIHFIDIITEYERFSFYKEMIGNSIYISSDKQDFSHCEVLSCCEAIILNENIIQETDIKMLKSWDEIIDHISLRKRKATIHRVTHETDVFVDIDLDGSGVCEISTGIGFFDHLLEQLGRHSGIDLIVKVNGDLYVDEHHTVEDTAIVLGESFAKALGDKRGIERYGFCLPMDDCLCNVAIDFGGRAWLVWDAVFNREKIGELPSEMLFHFFKSLSDGAKMNIHIKADGSNEHHKAEGIFKAFAKSIRMAVRRDMSNYQLPTTKGML